MSPKSDKKKNPLTAPQIYNTTPLGDTDPQSETSVVEDDTFKDTWQGPPHINTVKQDEAVLSFKLSVFTLS